MLTTYSAGLATVAGGGSDSQIAWLDVGIGAVCIGIIPGREERYKMHLRQAVELYNDALEIPENRSSGKSSTSNCFASEGLFYIFS
jgi:hypothetical protein